MKDNYTIIYNASSLLTLAMPGQTECKKGVPRNPDEMRCVGEIENGAIVFSESGIYATGGTLEIQRRFPNPVQSIDAGGKLVMPGFVDAHTHLVFSGNRSQEMQMRLQGATYLDILKSGGGINKTVQATRAASPGELKELGLKRLDSFLKHGTTTVEIKSGYGLDEPTEHKILDVIQELDVAHCTDLVATYLGAHTVPTGESRSDYMTWLVGNSLSDFSRKAKYFDVFCEEGAFSSEETKHLFEAALEVGFGLKLHAGQFNDLGMCGTAAKMGAISIDHLDHISDPQLETMGKCGCLGVLLPGVPFFLQTGVYPDIRRFRDQRVPFAIATDFNPGSCPSFSMPMMIALAVLKCHATIEEAICASTYNAGCTIGLGNSVGSLEPGKQADLIILDLEDYHEIPYYFGTNLVQSVWKKGNKVV